MIFMVRYELLSINFPIQSNIGLVEKPKCTNICLRIVWYYDLKRVLSTYQLFCHKVLGHCSIFITTSSWAKRSGCTFSCFGKFCAWGHLSRNVNFQIAKILRTATIQFSFRWMVIGHFVWYSGITFNINTSVDFGVMQKWKFFASTSNSVWISQIQYATEINDKLPVLKAHKCCQIPYSTSAMISISSNMEISLVASLKIKCFHCLTCQQHSIHLSNFHFSLIESNILKVMVFAIEKHWQNDTRNAVTKYCDVAAIGDWNCGK